MLQLKHYFDSNKRIDRLGFLLQGRYSQNAIENRILEKADEMLYNLLLRFDFFITFLIYTLKIYLN